MNIAAPALRSTFAGLAAAALLAGCASKPSPSSSSSSAAPAGGSHHPFREALQDSVRVPEKADALLLVHPFATNQPAGKNRTLAQIYVRIRSAGPDLAATAEGTPFLRAQATIKASNGFRLVRLYGAPSVDSAAGVYKVIWDTLGLDEWRVLVAELEGSLEPSAGKERLIGATLRTSRLSDGSLFETIEGTGMEWHRAGSPATLNKWTARNSLFLANGEVLAEAARRSEQGEHGQALALLDLQLSSVRALKELDPAGSAREEGRLAEARQAIATRSGVAAGTQAPEGVWTTLSGLVEEPSP